MGNLQVSTQSIQVTVETSVKTSRQESVSQPPTAAQPSSLERSDTLQLKPKSPKAKPISSPIEIVKKVGGGALLGGGMTAAFQSVITSVATERLQGPSLGGVSLGTALGAGIGLINIETGDKNLNAVKNTVGGALIGGSVLGMVVAAINTAAFERLMPASPIAIGVGAAIGAGIGLLNSEH